MSSSRAQLVAEILRELKRADKVAKYKLVADRAGFSAGANGRAMETCLRTIRRDWPHLQWWRAIRDTGLLEKDSEQVVKLQESGYSIEEADDSEEHVIVCEIESHTMSWETPIDSPVSSAADESTDSDEEEEMEEKEDEEAATDEDD
jgi:alkylated DNA nucleotide flippase Atl1